MSFVCVDKAAEGAGAAAPTLLTQAHGSHHQLQQLLLKTGMQKRGAANPATDTPARTFSASAALCCAAVSC